MELIKKDQLYVSQKHGIAFNGALSNLYIYFDPGQQSIESIGIAGDVSFMDAILAKILFTEIYTLQPEFTILTSPVEKAENILLVGDANFEDERFLKGINVAEQAMDMLSLPFVNYVFAAKDEEAITALNSKCLDLSKKVADVIATGQWQCPHSDNVKKFVTDHIENVSYDFTQAEIDGIIELTRMPFFHGMIDDIVESKFI
jgi:predicted solute-binding protein